ncbi:uncharacterized protein LOC127854716 [Dreissena polymorpha]|uniref:uncharacterized protein LOC127854716 n=1 Tax=Dreissena polymorpha TaxID=45954 RepID=UPI002263FE14|nr:uncharacterized protein LOC127854716 [Dreissena polymorpha]
MSIYFKWTTDSLTTEDHFMGLVNVERTDAESLLNAINQFCIGKGIDIRRCRFVGFDGANVMSGEVSGLQRRIRHLSPICLYMNCRNHRLALCLKHLMKNYPVLVDADALLLAIWKLFHYSPQRFQVLKAIQEAYGDEKLTLIRAATTRWLSHGNACVRFIDRYEACLDALAAIYDAKKEPEVYGLRLSVTTKTQWL